MRRGPSELYSKSYRIPSGRARLALHSSESLSHAKGALLLAFWSHAIHVAGTIGRFRMNSTSTSVFDLSPSEKLQLVEDLWDDLATAPEAVPVHDWQKEELARRKANLMKHPASGSTWEEVKRRVRSRYGR